MVNKLRKPQPKAQEEGPKANMLKRFGGKFKRAFSKKKLVGICCWTFDWS